MISSPVAWMVGNNLCRKFEQAEMHHDFTNLPIVPLYTETLVKDQFAEIKALMEQLKHLETQVYGGVTK